MQKLSYVFYAPLPGPPHGGGGCNLVMPHSKNMIADLPEN